MAVRRPDKEILDEIDDILYGVQSANTKNAPALLINVDNLDATDDDDDSGSSEAGGATGTGAPGSTEPLMDMSIFGLTSSAEVLLAELIRKGESKFGWVPDTKDPSKMRQEAGARNKGPQRHPLLSESQRFDGADPKLNALPTSNPEARENFNRLANELRPAARPTNTNVATPTYKPI